MANNDRFRARFSKRIEKAKTKFELFVKKLVIDIDTAIILKTPVLDGQLHWNWFIGNGFINKTTEEHTGNNKTGASQRNATLVNSLKVNGQIIYITNSLPYAYRIEYEGWSSVKAPSGMVRVTLVEVQSMARRIGVELRTV